MKNLYKLFNLSAALAVLIMGLESCKKDWLKPKPESFFIPDVALTDVIGFNAALNGCARTLKNEWYGDGAPIITETIFSEIAVVMQI